MKGTHHAHSHDFELKAAQYGLNGNDKGAP